MRAKLPHSTRADAPRVRRTEHRRHRTAPSVLDALSMGALGVARTNVLGTRRERRRAGRRAAVPGRLLVPVRDLD
jgi:hypothetical protein